MTTTLAVPGGETALQRESHLFRELFLRLGNAVLNVVFDLKPESANRRMRYLVFLFFLSGFGIILRNYPLGLWVGYIQDILMYSFNPAYAATYDGDPFTKFLRFGFDAITDPLTLQYLPIFLASFFIALQCAAIYLADIFELENLAVARSHVWEVALTGSDETIRISHGDISEEHRESSNYLIGGPGKVVVDFDSVALFERPDGTPHVIGPTGKEPGGKATLEGFERFREAIDIRDNYVDLRDQDPNSESVKNRSRDGIPITATDVRLMFSIYRGANPKPAPESPYPFSKEAVEQIVYKAASRVTPDTVNPSTYKFSWISNMIGLIRGRLGGFMSERNLTEYLATIGVPEVEKAKEREETIAEQVRELDPAAEDPPKPKEVKPPPSFTPRHQISNLFSEFAEEFTKNARNNGVELHWIGVGTWKTPIKNVLEKHKDAWILSQENMKNGSQEAMKKAEGESIIQRMQTLIKSVPLAAFNDIMMAPTKHSRKQSKRGDGRQKHGGQKHDDDLKLDPEELAEKDRETVLLLLSQALEENRAAREAWEYRDMDHEHAMKSLLLEYRKQFLEAVEFMKARNESVPQNIEEAIKHINDQLGHWAGS